MNGKRNKNRYTLSVVLHDEYIVIPLYIRRVYTERVPGTRVRTKFPVHSALCFCYVLVFARNTSRYGCMATIICTSEHARDNRERTNAKSDASEISPTPPFRFVFLWKEIETQIRRRGLCILDPWYLVYLYVRGTSVRV